REALRHHPDAVTLDVEGLEGRMGCRRSRVAVAHRRIGHVAAAPACDPRAQAEVGILAVGEEILIEKPDLVEHGAPVEGGTGARDEDVHSPPIALTVGLEPPPPAPDAVTGDEEPGPVEEVRSSPEADPRGA